MEIIRFNTSEMSWTKVLLDNLQNVANDNDSESDLHQSNHNIDILTLFQYVATCILYGFSLSPPLSVSYKLSDFDASMFPPQNEFRVHGIF